MIQKHAAKFLIFIFLHYDVSKQNSSKEKTGGFSLFLTVPTMLWNVGRMFFVFLVGYCIFILVVSGPGVFLFLTICPS